MAKTSILVLPTAESRPTAAMARAKPTLAKQRRLARRTASSPVAIQTRIAPPINNVRSPIVQLVQTACRLATVQQVVFVFEKQAWRVRCRLLAFLSFPVQLLPQARQSFIAFLSRVLLVVIVIVNPARLQ